jgi:MoxR-like ATPase
MAEPVKSGRPTSSVELLEDHVAIHHLSVDGALADLVRAGVEDGRDPEAIVREAIDVGAAVLVHGAAKSTVDAVGAEVDRLLTALNERSLPYRIPGTNGWQGGGKGPGI